MKKSISIILVTISILTVIFCTPFSANAASALKIPSGAKYYGGHMYYAFKNKSITWKKAKVACEKRGGHLVTITSKKENDFVSSLYSLNDDDYYLFIGIYDKNLASDSENGHVTWTKPAWVTGEKYKYSNWSKDDCGINPCTGMYDDHKLGYGVINIDGEFSTTTNDINTNSYDDECYGYICEWEVGKVSGIKQIKATASSVILTWKDNDLVKKFIVYYYNTATKKYEKYDTVTKTSITISGLNSATTYKMAIAPVITNNGKSQTLPKTTLSVVTKPGAVKGLKIEDGVSLTWKAVKGADGYVIYSYDSSAKKWSAYKTVKKNSYNIGSKFGNKTQQFKVAAFKKSSDGTKFFGGDSNIVKR